MDRRRFLQTSGGVAFGTLLTQPMAFAAAPTEQRLVLVILRGGLDGLHALPPFADPDYQRLRPTLALRPPGEEGGAIALGAEPFGLNPALQALVPLYASGELLFVPAAATRYAERSHFDGQNMLENGSGRPFGAADGWLNRALMALHGDDRQLGLALGPTVPLILQGDRRVQTWAPTHLPPVDDDFLMRLGMTYAGDRAFEQALQDARGSLKPVLDPMAMDVRGGTQGGRKGGFLLSASACADLLSRADGPRVAVLESQGWDTHFDQPRRLQLLLTELAQGVLALKQGLGHAWSRTAVLVVSEFGRTASENASRGTDHGTGGLAMLAGGGVAGGRVAGTWPGLDPSALIEARDVRTANPYESVFKALLIEHLGLPPGLVEDRVLPDSRALRPMEGLFRPVRA